jgi:hypothetical protein
VNSISNSSTAGSYPAEAIAVESTLSRSKDLPPLYIYYIEFFDTSAGKLISCYITGGCVEEVIAKFRAAEGYESEIYTIQKTKGAFLIY